MSEHSTYEDARTYPRQVGRNIAAALVDGRRGLARMYWEMIDASAQAIAAAEVSLALAERGYTPLAPSQVAAWVEGA